MTKYNIPSNLKKPQWVIDHFRYLNERDKTLTEHQKECSSELTQICKKYENYTDKGPTGPYYIKHNYTEIYGDLLRYYKNRKNNILEIGIRQGGSLKMWEEYFKKSTIYGIDLSLKAITVNMNNCKIFKGNAYDKNIVNKYFNILYFI